MSKCMGYRSKAPPWRREMAMPTHPLHVVFVNAILYELVLEKNEMEYTKIKQ
jgi:hypothetical protein